MGILTPKPSVRKPKLVNISDKDVSRRNFLLGSGLIASWIAVEKSGAGLILPSSAEAAQRKTPHWKATKGGIGPDVNMLGDYFFPGSKFEVPPGKPEHLHFDMLVNLYEKVALMKCFIGDGNFNRITMDEMFKWAERGSRWKAGNWYKYIKPFTADEKEALYQLFSMKSTDYGFHGEKANEVFTAGIKDGHGITNKYVIKNDETIREGPSLEKVKKIEELFKEPYKGRMIDFVITSGHRGMAKQNFLFLQRLVKQQQRKLARYVDKKYNRLGKLSRNRDVVLKAARIMRDTKNLKSSQGRRFKDEFNASLVSRNIAPPGYSFHFRNDFDVGEYGDDRNFEPTFEDGDVYAVLKANGLIALRYPWENLLGVRYEPFHQMVIAEGESQFNRTWLDLREKAKELNTMLANVLDPSNSDHIYTKRNDIGDILKEYDKIQEGTDVLAFVIPEGPIGEIIKNTNGSLANRVVQIASLTV